MSNVVGIIAGVVVAILGVLLLVCWWPMFIAVFKGMFPILLILIGLGVLLYYFSEIKSKLDLKKEDTSAETK
ncbi:MAG: hypothetical protein FJ106_11555 [Deltaproteobacteria bacterium]|nr:hypothetical protein [Deltaproteobacteria bacterium]